MDNKLTLVSIRAMANESLLESTKAMANEVLDKRKDLNETPSQIWTKLFPKGQNPLK